MNAADHAPSPVATRYAVKELFLTLQGEGRHAGRVAVFCRFAGCNLWSGREADRATAACTFCDTDFVGLDGTFGGRYDAVGLADAVARLWPGGGRPLVVCTGGEPLLQLDAALIAAFHARGFAVSVETNGSIAPAPPRIDWLCVSPKAGAPFNLRAGDELKLVWPQAGFDLGGLEALPFERFSLQPLDGGDTAANVRAVLAQCLARPRWELSLQTHKVTGIR